MKPWARCVTVLLISATGLMGCHRGVVPTMPVPPQQAGVEIYPSKKRIWVPGDHHVRKGKHTFRRGRYRAKSHDKPVVIAAHWKKTPRGYVWVPAKWRKF